MRKTTLALGLILAAGLSSAALAGSATLKKGDKTISLWCNNGGCYVADKISMFKKGPKTRLGPGGSSNFQKHHASYKAKGWS